jgi:RNA polymerase sigma factor (sigma-70 family)
MMDNYQQKLFPYAYNVLGSVEDAKDAVQDVIMRFLSLPKEGVINEQAYLIRMVINQSINMKNRTKKFIGDRTWLPEPVVTEIPNGQLNDKDLLSYSMLVLLEGLKARERAIFILKKAYSLGHNEIAEILDISVQNSRKLFSRANKKLQERKPVHTKPKHSSAAFFQQYLQVLRNGDLETLKTLLSEDVSLTADGGSKIQVAQAVTVGKGATAELILFVYQKYQQHLNVVYLTCNHQPALFYFHTKQLIICQVFDLNTSITNIRAIYSVVDPAKMRHLANHDIEGSTKMNLKDN